MSIDRRELLKAGIAVSAAMVLPNAGRAEAGFAPRPGAWRAFQVLTRLEIVKADGNSQAWIPVPAVNELNWFKSLGSTWTSNGRAVLVRAPKYGAEMLHVEWADGENSPVVEVTSRIATRDRAIDLKKPGRPAPLSAAERDRNTRGTELIPIDGIVKQTSDQIVANANAETDIEKARAIYEWIVDNTFRDAAVRGCGIGDIAAMLRTGNLGGKCADLNALYVGLARAAGLPARDVYGIRVAPSRFDYRSSRHGLGGDHRGAALPLGSLSRRLRLGAGRRRRCAQGRPRGTADQPGDRGSQGRCGTQGAVRLMGDQLAGV